MGRVLPVLRESCSPVLWHCRCCKPETSEAPGSCRAISSDPRQTCGAAFRKETPGFGEPALVVEKLLYGLIIFLINNCLERLACLSFRDESRPALPWLDRNLCTVRNLPLQGAFPPFKSCLCVSRLWQGNGLRTCPWALCEGMRPTRAGLMVASVAHGPFPAAGSGEVSTPCAPLF